MITEVKLQSTSAESTAAFWSAIFNVPAEELGHDLWRITPPNGPAVVVTTTRVRAARSTTAAESVVSTTTAWVKCSATF